MFQVSEVYKRTLIMYKREPVLTKARMAQTIIVALLVGLIFLQLGDTQASMEFLIYMSTNASSISTSCLSFERTSENQKPLHLRRDSDVELIR